MQIWEHLDQFIVRDRISLPQKNTYWPSEASIVLTDVNGRQRIEGKCLRASFLRRVGTVPPSKPSPYSQYIFLMGKAIEVELARKAKEAGIWVASSVRYYDEPRNISGEIDLIIWDPTTQQEIPCEIKTFYGYQATKEICGNTKQVGFPRWSNLLQIALYLDFCREIWPYGKLLYFARDSMKRAEYKISISNHDQDEAHRMIVVDDCPTQVCMADIYRRFATLDAYLQEKVLPPNDFFYEYSDDQMTDMVKHKLLSKTKLAAWEKKKERVGDWQCRGYCEWSSLCWGTTTLPDEDE